MALYDLIDHADRNPAFLSSFSRSDHYKPVTQFNENILLWAQCAGEGIVVADLQNKILFANPFVTNLTKYSQSELESLALDQLFNINHKSWFKPKEKHNDKQAIFQYRRFKAQLIKKEEKAIAVKGTSAKTRWFSQPAIILVFKAIQQPNKKEKALKFGLKKMRNLFRRKSRELSTVNQQLQQLQKSFSEKEDEVNKLTNDLVETNYALSALARHLDNDKKAYEAEISRSVITNILPIIKTLQKEKRLSSYSLELNLLESHIASLSPDGIKNQGVVRNLTEAEGQIATLIKKGMTSKKIANLLCISNETVRTHRKNIRRKLKIQNTNINLRAYLNQNTTSSR